MVINWLILLYIQKWWKESYGGMDQCFTNLLLRICDSMNSVFWYMFGWEDCLLSMRQWLCFGKIWSHKKQDPMTFIFCLGFEIQECVTQHFESYAAWYVLSIMMKQISNTFIITCLNKFWIHVFVAFTYRFFKF